jgi:CHASE2 domain-containing sensor protein
MLDILREGEAQVIGFDLTLAEPDKSTVVEAIDEIKMRYLENAKRISRSPPERTLSNHTELVTYLDEVKAAHDYDHQLAKAIQQSGNVVLGFYHFLNRASASHLTPEKHATCHQLLDRVTYTTIKFPPETPPQPLRLCHSFGVEPNLPIFSEAAKSFGHFTVVKDGDGHVRRIPLLIEYMGNYYPSLDLEVARVYLNLQMPPIIHALGKEGGGSVDGIQIGKRYIPTDEQGNLLINFYGPRDTFPVYSLSDVIFRKIAPPDFQS